MTPDEIRNTSINNNGANFFFREIALQLALINESMRGVHEDIQSVDNAIQCVEQAVRLS